MTRPTSLRRSTATAMLAMQVLASGCHSWQTQSGSAETVLTASPREQVRIATVSEPKMREMKNPRVSGDTLYGTMADTTKVEGVPLSDVTAIQVQKGSAGKTVALVLGATAIVVGVGALAASAACNATYGSC